jgi:hypothetical protein
MNHFSISTATNTIDERRARQTQQQFVEIERLSLEDRIKCRDVETEEWPDEDSCRSLPRLTE